MTEIERKLRGLVWRQCTTPGIGCRPGVPLAALFLCLRVDFEAYYPHRLWLERKPMLEYRSLPEGRSRGSAVTQRRTMGIALALLLIALGLILYRDRDFWFPDKPETLEGQAVEHVPAAASPVVVAAASTQPPPATHSAATSKHIRIAAPAPSESTPENTAIVNRTVLPPLEVEVVAGDAHRMVHPGTNSVRVDLQPGSPTQAIAVPPASVPQTSPHLSNAADRIKMSADATQVVSSTVKPDYPLLARQMKVQGSVVLQALIGRDGQIQDLHIVSGPPILAAAAREAVRQWHFKPHYLGEEAVETQARITVNFTISTN